MHTFLALPQEALNILEQGLQIIMADQAEMYIQAAVNAVLRKVVPGMCMVRGKIRRRHILSPRRQCLIHCGTDLDLPAIACTFRSSHTFAKLDRLAERMKTR